MAGTNKNKRLDRIVSANDLFKLITIDSYELPLSKQPIWVRRLMKSTAKAESNPKIMRLINDLALLHTSKVQDLKWFEKYMLLETELLFTHGLYNGEINLLIHKVRGGSNSAYWGGIKIVSQRDNAIVPYSRKEKYLEKEYTSYRNNNTKTEISIPRGTSKKQLHDFIDYYWEVIEIINGKSETKEVGAINLNTYKAVLCLKESGISRLKIASELNLDIKQVARYLNLAKETITHIDVSRDNDSVSLNVLFKDRIIKNRIIRDDTK